MPDPDCDPLDLALVTQETGIERVHYFDQTDSTNTQALAHAAGSSEPLNELFVAQQQTGGRGRGQNRWWSDGGSLTWSVLTRPLTVPPAHLPQVSLTMGLAICEAVEQFVEGDVSLKWPNDVFLNHRKAAGILIELPASTPPRLVVGVGLNVNNSTRNAPAELRESAIAMCDALPTSGLQLDRTAVLVACLSQMEEQLARFENGDPSLASDWRSRSLLTGRQIRVETPRQMIEGRCEGLADDGALCIQTSGGIQQLYGGVVVDFQ